jgi:hypothetical protein
MKIRILVGVLLVLGIAFAAGSTVASAEEALVTICHNPGPNEITLHVAASSQGNHIAHGDTPGACGTIVAQCTDGWTSQFTETEKSYLLEVDRDLFEGRSTYVTAIDRLETSLRVEVTSITTGNSWTFDEPACGSGCEYLLGWYGGTTHPIGEGTGTYLITITQENEGLVQLYCAD